jgi:hypothetical protein
MMWDWLILFIAVEFAAFTFADSDDPLTPWQKWLFWIITLPAILAFTALLILNLPMCFAFRWHPRSRSWFVRRLDLLQNFENWYRKRIP